MSTFHDSIIKDDNGDIHFPRTDADSVRTGDGSQTVEQRLDTVDTQIGTLNTNLNGIKGTLIAGQTSITLSDAKITTDSSLYPSTSIFGVNPTGATVVNGSVTYTFPVQATNMGVRVVVL